MKLAVLLMILPTYASAYFVEKCGVYEVEGRFDDTSGTAKLFLDYKTNSQTTITFSGAGYKSVKMPPHSGVNYRAKIKITEPCWYDCKGEYIATVNPIDIFKEPASFASAKKIPLPGTEVGCEKLKETK